MANNVNVLKVTPTKSNEIKSQNPCVIFGKKKTAKIVSDENLVRNCPARYKTFTNM